MSSVPAPQDHLATEPHDSGHGHHSDHPAHLAHHWESLPQQFEAGKLGMWLFLATEILLFGGLFCAYSVWRGNHPELFKYGSQFLDTNLGATNTAVLILSSLTMAWAVTAAQKNQQLLLKIMLILTLAGAATFLVIKYFEYTHKFHLGYYPGLKFYEPPSEHAAAFWGQHQGTTPTTMQEEAASGSQATSEAAGITPAHESTSAPHRTAAGAGADSSESSQFTVDTVAVTPPRMPVAEAPSFERAKVGPRGVATDAKLETEPYVLGATPEQPDIHPLRDPNRPDNAHMFFNIYFMMTGLHGIHVVIGMIVIGWLLIRAFRGEFNSMYFTPVDLGGLYWHVVDLIWIFLFPLFYLI